MTNLEKARFASAATLLLEGEPLLLNVDHVIEVSPARWPKVNAAGARALADFLVAPATQGLIGRYGLEKVVAPLFTADAGKKPESLGR